MDADKFLLDLWERAPTDHEFGFIASKSDKRWDESAISDPRIQFLAPDKDWYFSPLKYKTAQRRMASITKAGVLFADMDELHLFPTDVPPPSTIVSSGSSGHFHYYWKLEEPIPIGDWMILNKTLTYLLKADKGGWDVTQMLRIPGTINQKNGNQVEITGESNATFQPSDFPISYDFPKVTNQAAMSLPDKTDTEYLRMLDLEHQLYLTSSKAQINILVKDRSKVLWKIYKDAHSVGIPLEALARIVQGSSINKFDDEENLVRDIARAYGQ